MATIKEAMTLAVNHHQAGRLHQAEDIYREVLVVRPTHADALHLLGVVALQTGRQQFAVDQIKRAIKLAPNEAAFHNNLGEAYRTLNKFPEAEASCRRAIQLQPEYPEAHYNLGLILARLGKHEEASNHFRRTRELRPGDADSAYFLGLSLVFLNRIEEAMASLRQAIALKQDYTLAHLNLGHILRQQGKHEEAASCYRRTIELSPNDNAAHVNLGHCLKAMGKLEEAIVSYRRGLDIKNDDFATHNLLAITLAERGKLDEAIVSYLRCLHHKPDYAGAHSNLGNALAERGRLDDAIASYRRALELEPDFLAAHVNLGNALRDRGRLEEAISSYKRALEIKADDAMTLSHLGTALKDSGKLEESIASYRKALEVAKDRGTHSSLLFTLNFCPGYDGQTLCEEHRVWNRLYAQPLAKHIRAHSNNRSVERRLKIGYISPDFRTHCQSFFTVPLLSSHDHSKYEIFIYSDVVNADRLTERLRSFADNWREITGMSDEKVAEMIRNDQIDIMVDLTMHMSRTRLLALARKPAPVQVTWLAYPGTTGVSAIDYRFTDVNLDPPGMFEGCYTEESYRLPDTFWCYDPLTTEPAVAPLPALERGYITFGNFNNFCKINANVLKIWAEVLKAVPNSKLIMLTGEGPHRDQTVQALQEAGISRERVELRGRLPRLRYLELYNQTDIGLDTIPYNGHTTSLDSFWMGVPVVTLLGNTVVGRAGLCQLRNLGMPELIAETPEQYVRIVADLAKDLPRLQNMRATLREKMRVSPLMDGPRFARNVETAYRTMWQRWCTK
jgi:predicted O-linked N-acetylglucosamine transferase (SPINDLY family)